jgi:phenylacetate-CoA ligase
MAHVPYYRRLLGEAGIRPDGIRSLADLSRVPVTTKAALRAAGLEQTTAEDLPASRRWATTTSGSSGMPLQLHFDLAAEDTRFATFMLALEWAGLGVADVEIRMGNPYRDESSRYPGAPSRLASLGRRALLGQRVGRLQAMRPTPEDLSRLVRELAGRRAWFLRGFPSMLVTLGDQVIRSGRDLPSDPRAVISRGETLTGVRRAVIERAFRRPPIDHYACTEMAHLAQSCPDAPTGLHVLGDRVIVQVVRADGRPAGPGETGRVLLTDLENRVMPLINYAVGDLATVGAPCPCGRGLASLATIDGREAEVIRLPTGEQLSAFTLESCINAECDVGALSEFQIVQTALERVVVKLVTTPRFTGAEAKRLRRAFEKVLGPDVSVELEEVASIPPEPSGKRLAVKTEVPL